ncbi:MAG: hypothetical protein C0425_04680 [Chlorobiaceae bacterium]|nr:hypothetical protein [Chlorobiaceae bacterium]MBA4309612.1 hypothetical protein [Chlorobiaceae bacterium]
MKSLAKYLSFFSIVLISIFLSSCVTPVDQFDNTLPTLTVSRPANNDTIQVGAQEIIYEVFDDQGMAYLEVFVNGVLNLRYPFLQTGAKPPIFINTDSTGITKRISYSVRAVDLAGNITNSPVFSNIYIATPKPPAPNQLELTRVTDSQIRLTWRNTGKFLQYFEVWRKTNEGNFVLLRNVSPDTLSIIDVIPDIKDNYTYRVRSKTIDNFSDFSSDSFLPRITPPPAPFNLRLHRITDFIVNLTWSDSARNIIRYELWRKVDATGLYEMIKQMAPNSFNTNDIVNDPSRSYFYKIRSLGVAGFSEFSNEVIHQSNISGGLIPPRNFRGRTLGTNRVLLEWQDVNISKNFFKIERRADFFGAQFQQIALLPSNATSFRDSAGGLFSNGTFFYRIKVFTDIDSATSNEIFVTTSSYDLFAPTNLIASNLNAKTIRLNWVDVNGNETKTFIERRTSLGGTFVVIGQVAANVRTFDDSLTFGGEVYTYRVRAADDNNLFSDYSNEVTITKTFTNKVINAFENKLMRVLNSQQKTAFSEIARKNK